MHTQNILRTLVERLSSACFDLSLMTIECSMQGRGSVPLVSNIVATRGYVSFERQYRTIWKVALHLCLVILPNKSTFLFMSAFTGPN